MQTQWKNIIYWILKGKKLETNQYIALPIRISAKIVYVVELIIQEVWMGLRQNSENIPFWKKLTILLLVWWKTNFKNDFEENTDWKNWNQENGFFSFPS